MVDVVRRTAEQVFIPLTVGGGIRTPDDVDTLLRAGADKVSINTAAIARPELLREIGAAVRLAVHRAVGRRPDGARGQRADAVGLGGHHARRPPRHRDRRRRVGARAAEELGVGEILLNSMDADGTRAGFDLEMIAAVRAAVDVPVIASGGAGAVEHFAPAVRAGADAVLAASVFHFGTLRIGEVKDALRAARGGPVTSASERASVAQRCDRR